MRWLLPLELIEAVALLMVGWAAMRWSMRAEGRLWAAAGDRWLSERLRLRLGGQWFKGSPTLSGRQGA